MLVVREKAKKTKRKAGRQTVASLREQLPLVFLSRIALIAVRVNDVGWHDVDCAPQNSDDEFRHFQPSRLETRKPIAG